MQPYINLQDQLDAELRLAMELSQAEELSRIEAENERRARKDKAREQAVPTTPSAPTAPVTAQRYENYDFDRDRKEFRDQEQQHGNPEELSLMDLADPRKLTQDQGKQRIRLEENRKKRRETFVTYVQQLHGECTIIMSKDSRVAIPVRIAQLDFILIKLNEKLTATQQECADCKGKAAALGNEAAVSHYVNDEIEKAKSAFEESVILERIIAQIGQSIRNLQERFRQYQVRLRQERLEALKKKRIDLDAKLDAEFAELGLEKTYIPTYKMKDTGQAVYMCPEDYDKTYMGQMALYVSYFKAQSSAALNKIRGLAPKIRQLGPKVQALVPYVKPDNLKKVATAVFNRENIVYFFTCGKRVPLERRLADPGYNDATRPLLYEPAPALPQGQQLQPMYPALTLDPPLHSDSRQPSVQYQPSVYPNLLLDWERLQSEAQDADQNADGDRLRNRGNGPGSHQQRNGEKRI